MKRVVQVGQSRKAILGTAGAVVSLLAPQALGVVTFEFRDVAGSVDANPNGVEVSPGGVFSFDVWADATEGERLLGVEFKLRFEEYGTGGLTTQTFTVTGEPDRTGSPFDDNGSNSFSGQRLTPENADPDNPEAPSELGALVSDINGTGVTGERLFVATIALTVDATMPPGTYQISPYGDFYRWIDTNFYPRDFDATTVYTVSVIPELDSIALWGSLGLLAFGAYRRMRN